MSLFKLFRRPQAPKPVVLTPQPIQPQPEERDLINEVFPDRSAGRWCAFCGQAGNHHTDRHEHFLTAAREQAA